MIDTDDIRSVRDGLNLPDNSTAIRLVKWLTALYNAGLLKPPSYNFLAQINGKTHILSAHLVDPADGQLPNITFGCSHCAAPVQTGRFPPKAFGPPLPEVPQCLRLHAPAFLVCEDCQKKLGTPGVWRLEKHPDEENES